MQGTPIIQDKGLEAWLTSSATNQINLLLSNTTLGTKGGLQYQLKDIDKRIAAYNNIRFVSLYANRRMAGTIGLCYREILTGGKRWHSSHLRYLSFLPMFQATISSKAKPENRNRQRDSRSMKEKILSFFRYPKLLDFPGYTGKEKHIMYAYTESRNERSKNLIDQAGFEYIRSFLTVAFSRFIPKHDPSVAMIEEGDKEKMSELLAGFYADYSFYTDEFTWYDNRYYVLKENGEIIAGVSALPTTYTIIDVPGIWGWVLMKIFPWAPWYRRLFRPGEFRFLSLGQIYYKQGREKELEKLFESVCAINGYNTCLTWVDDRSNLFETLRTKLNMGAVNRILNARPGLVYANFINLTDEEKGLFYEKPAFISGFDFT